MRFGDDVVGPEKIVADMDLVVSGEHKDLQFRTTALLDATVKVTFECKDYLESLPQRDMNWSGIWLVSHGHYPCLWNERIRSIDCLQ